MLIPKEKDKDFHNMPSQTQHWTLLDSHPISQPDYHHYTRQFKQDNRQGCFIIASESLPSSKESQAYHSRSDIGAKLAIEATQRAFSKILDNRLDFADTFLKLFSKQWKARVLLHAIQHPILNGTTLSAEQLMGDVTISHEQQRILSYYDPSIALVYQRGKEVILLQLGDTQVALLNQRYHCEIRKPTQRSLTNLLVEIEHDTKIAFKIMQVVDTKEKQLEIITLLSHQYTASTTAARLNSNIINLYRQLESNKSTDKVIDNNNLLTLIKKQPDNGSTKTCPQTTKKDQPKKSLVAYAFSLLALTTAGSYYLWQAQATEIKSPTLLENQQSIPPQINSTTTTISTTSTTKQQQQPLAENITSSAQLTPLDKQKIEEQKRNLEQQRALAEVKAKEDELNRQKQQAEEAILKQQLEEQKQAEAQAQQAAAEKEAEKVRIQQQKAEEEKQRLLEEQKAQRQVKKEQELLKQQQAEKLAKAKKEALKQQQQEEERKAKAKEMERKKQQKEAREEEKRQQKIVKEQKEKEEQKEQKERERQAKVEADKVEAEKKREQQRLKAEKEKEAKRLALKLALKKEQAEETQKTQDEATDEQNLNQHQQLLKDQLSEKKRNILAELKKQQQKKQKVISNRQKLTQKATVHQLIIYSKTFNKHTSQLKLNLDKTKALEDEGSSSHRALHRKKLLQGQEVVIRKRLNSFAEMYLSRLKQICEQPKVYPISTTSADKIEKIARKVIAKQLNDCSQVKSLSAGEIVMILLDKYMK